MKRTHWAINYSDACDIRGSGQCDGFMEEGEGNPNSDLDQCTCPCHGNWDLPDTIAEVKVWHDEFHGLLVKGQ